MLSFRCYIPNKLKTLYFIVSSPHFIYSHYYGMLHLIGYVLLEKKSREVVYRIVTDEGKRPMHLSFNCNRKRDRLFNNWCTVRLHTLNRYDVTHFISTTTLWMLVFIFFFSPGGAWRCGGWCVFAFSLG